jgi:sodium-dependent phosphate cotransporter
LNPDMRDRIIKSLMVILTIYLFLLSIKLLGHSFKLFGTGFAETLLQMTSNPFAGLIIGIVSTSLIQSSSTTTSIVVGLVAGGALNIENAIPIIMGANIGTTITNTLVSMGHITRRIEFQRAFGASIVHDFFNICSVILLFPIELNFHIIQKSATLLERGFAGAGGLHIFNPLKIILDPMIDFIDGLISHLPHNSIILLIFSLILLFASLSFLIKTIRSLVLEKLEIIINNYLFRNDIIAFVLGMLMTFVVQSSSVTTSIIIPLAGAGLISIRQIYPYTLGANIGTTGTAILASLATQSDIAVTVAFAHLCFNIFGIAVFYPLKFIPIRLSEFVAEKATHTTKNMVIFITIYVLLHFIPVILIFMT